ncbi:MAG: hypothetical protein CMF80_08260 [Candidatus Marinimicrobia bacterium]|nr:hypothetical protein [Candidatus Neomarinimicrobiota bacterium]|tara:strand:+ start:183 stop:383 length:201 start_codon:yes stop_codon:yes gene_type:complete
MESPLEHLLHGAVLTSVLYFVMKFLLKQSENVAVTRSLVIGLVATLYMLMFGHGAPTKLNPVLNVF